MRNFTLLALLCLIMGAAQAQQTQITIRLDAAQLQNPDCFLNQGVLTNDIVYMHSGACASNPQFCLDSIKGFGSPVWEHVVGNWGMNDNVGIMTFDGNAKWSISMTMENYYTQNIAAGSTPLPQGATPYTMGLVFRDLDGTFEGKDDMCGDIFIVDLQTNNPKAVSGVTGQPFPAVTVEKVTVSNDEVNIVSGLVASPNPSQGRLNVDMALRYATDQFSLRVYNHLGQEVAILTDGPVASGLHQHVWDATGHANGLYFVIATEDGVQVASQKVILAQ